MKHCMELYFNTTAPDPMHHATSHSSLPTTSWFSPGLPYPKILTQSNTFGTNYTNVIEAETTPLQTCVSCSRHSSRSGSPSQSKWFTTWSSPSLRDAEQLLIFEEDKFPTVSRFPSRKIPTDWTVSWTKRVPDSWTFTYINSKMKFQIPDFLENFF